MASSKISSLDIFLRGNTQDLDKGLDRATNGIGKFSNAVNEQSNKVNEQLNGIGSGVAAQVQSAVANPIGALTSLLSAIGGKIKQAFLDPIGTVKAAITFLPNLFRTVGESILGSLGSVASKLKGLFGAAKPQGAAGVAPGVARGATAVANMGATASEAASGFAPLSLVMGSVATTIGAVAVAGIAGAAAIVGLGAAGLHLANQQAPIIASMSKTAEVLNMSTRSYSALAMRLGDDTAATGMEHLERSLSEAAIGGGATAEALNRVGLNAHNLTNMLPEDQLNALADALQKMPNHAERMRLAFQLFGRGAAPEFLAALSQGKEGLQRMQAEAERFGLTFTESQAEAVRRSNKAWGQWGKALDGIGRQLAVALAPIWETIGTILGNIGAKLVEWVKAAAPYIDLVWQAFKAVASAIGDIFGPAIDWLREQFSDAFTSIGESINTIIPWVKRAWAELKDSGVVTFLGNVVKWLTQAYYMLSGVGDAVRVWKWLAAAIAGAMPYLAEFWAIFKAGVNMVLEILQPLWDAIVEAFWAVVEGIKQAALSLWKSITDVWKSIFGESKTTWADIKQGIMEFLIFTEFQFKRWKDFLLLGWDTIKLGALIFYEKANEGFVALVNAMLTLWYAAVNKIRDALNWLIEQYNKVAKKLGTEELEKFAKPQEIGLEVSNIDQLKRDIERLAQSIAERKEGLTEDFRAFLARRLLELQQATQTIEQAAQDRVRQQGSTPTPETKDNAALEKGSVEAFKVIAGYQGDKQFYALQDMTKILQRLQQIAEQQLNEEKNRINVGMARL